MKTIARISLLSLALATAGVVSEVSAQQSTLAQWTSRMPMNGGVQRIDSNGDGRVNVIGYDVSRNGRVDAVRFDLNFDGYFETVAIADPNGSFALFYFDTNRNGVLDTAIVDYYRDGRYFVGYDRRGTGQFSGWVPLPSNTEMPIEALYPSSMTIGGKNAGFRVTGVPEVDRLLIRQQERAICAVAECVYRVP